MKLFYLISSLIFTNLLFAQNHESVINDFNFLIGKWKVTEKVIVEKDTTYHGTSIYKIYKSHDNTTLKEDWIYNDNGKISFKASLLRTYDKQNNKWMLYYADDNLNSQIWEGKKVDNEWWFHRERHKEGKKILVKINWKQINKNLVHQYIYRSFDEGNSWILGSILIYKK